MKSETPNSAPSAPTTHTLDRALSMLSESGLQLDKDAGAFVEYVCSQPGGFDALSRTLLRAYAESVGIAERMREARGVMEHATLDKLHLMDEKLDEIAAATATATNDILDGLNRSISLVDQLAENPSRPVEAQADALTTLRNELYDVMEHLQFHDITTQQLNHISSVLGDIRSRINVVVRVFAPYTTSGVIEAIPAPAGAFDPDATTVGAPARQAVADEVYAARIKQA